MFRLITFGHLALLRDGEGAPMPSVQRRSLALLAILASSRSNGVSREKVIGILWPESDAESARASLRQALFATRREMQSDEVILGTSELSLNPAMIASDVNEFIVAIKARDYERAVELHGGYFLDTVQVRSSAEFDRWCDSQRSVFTGEYKRALEQLAAAASARGQNLNAVAWWRRLVLEDPLSSRYAAGLMTAFVAAGDSGAALNHYRAYETLVREELSSAPDSAVTSMANRIRADDGAAGMKSGGSPIIPKGPLLETKVDAAIPEQPTESKPSIPRRWAMGVAVILVTSVPIAIGFIPGEQSANESARRVVIAPFENKTGDRRLDALGAMTADWITHGLSRTGLVSVIDPGTSFFAAKDARERAGSISGNAAGVRAISLATAADIVTTGDYFQKGDSLEFHARVTDASDDRVIASIEPVTVSADNPISAVEVVRQRVLGVLAKVLDPGLSEVLEPHATPPTFDAYRAYNDGLQHFNRSDFGDAAVMFRKAYALDTSFVGALIWATLAHGDDGNPERAIALLDTLYLKRARLSPLDRYALAAMRASYAGSIDSSIVAAKAAGALAPRSQWVFKAGFLLNLANRPRESIELLERLDPMRGWLKGHAFYWRVLSDGKHLSGNYEGEQKVIERGLKVAPSDKNLLWLALRILPAQGRIRDLDSSASIILASTDPMAAGKIANLIFELRAHGHGPDAERLLARARPYYEMKWKTTASGRLGYGQILFESQRWGEARRALEVAREDFRDAGWLFGMIGICAAAAGDTTAAVAIADSLAHLKEGKPQALFYRAAVLARLQRRDEALNLLRQSYASGYSKVIRGHATRFFFPDLWGGQSFEEFFKAD